MLIKKLMQAGLLTWLILNGDKTLSFSQRSQRRSRENIFQFLSSHSSFIIITFYSFMVLVSMEHRSSGRCRSTLTETQCSNGPYPRSSYVWKSSLSDVRQQKRYPIGCYVRSGKDVHFNKGAGTDCTSERNCLCKKGSKFTPFFIYYF